MSDATRLMRTPDGVRLCAIDDIAEDGARGFVLQMRAGRFHGFVVRKPDAVYGYVDRCPHAGVTLARRLDDYLTPSGSLIACSWHGALFEPATGRCLGGPCMGQALAPWPVRIEDGWIVTSPTALQEPDG